MSTKKTKEQAAEKAAPMSIEPVPEVTTSKGLEREKEVWKVPLSQVIVDETFNKREDAGYGDLEALADSIESAGQLVPAIGYRKGDKFILTAGHRRFAALQIIARRTGQEPIMKMLKGAKDNTGRLIEQFIENVREGNSEYDRALIIGGLMTEGLTQQEVGKRLGIPQPMVSKLKKLLSAPQEVQDAMRNKEVSPVTVGKMLATLKGDAEAVTQAVREAKDAAKAEGKTTATDRHSKVAGTRTPQTIMKQFVAKYEAKVAAEEAITNAEAFALDLFKKVLTKPSDQAIAALLRKYN